jgi:hypothetical protein
VMPIESWLTHVPVFRSPMCPVCTPPATSCLLSAPNWAVTGTGYRVPGTGLEVDTPSRFYGHFHATLETCPRHADDVLIIGTVVEPDVS